MQLDVQDFLRLAEQTGSIVFWDTESTGLDGSYNSMLVESIKPYNEPPLTFQVEQLGNDRKVLREAKEVLEGALAWVTYYGRLHDVPLMNTRLLKWGLEPLKPHLHLDMYWQVRKLKTGRRSQAHVLEFLNTSEQKMSLSPSVWSEMGMDFEKNIKTLVKRCESDTAGLEALYKRLKGLVQDLKK